MNHGILGKKREMTQIFDEGGNVVTVTIIDISNSVIVDANKEGGIVTIGIGKKKRPINSLKGKFKNINYVPERIKQCEIYNDSELIIGKAPQSGIEVGDKVMVTGISKGKGFQGVVKRFGFAGGPKTHG